ncbi:hypothetical protein C900_01530 [Fulvivirga imtechensis AK7]|uniref:Uncharacterized protein n=1 Tax=Fulvivirga imtechensis AK7 TaxID=1237149 RepID=L8JZ30_9BACT|nr:hypothetical protein C900_01530 [Fulvivirga imtechensis AK7]
MIGTLRIHHLAVAGGSYKAEKKIENVFHDMTSFIVWQRK